MIEPVKNDLTRCHGKGSKRFPNHRHSPESSGLILFGESPSPGQIVHDSYQLFIPENGHFVKSHRHKDSPISLDKTLRFCYAHPSTCPGGSCTLFFLEATMAKISPTIPDQDLVCLLIEMLTKTGTEQKIWQGSFSIGQRLEVWLHRYWCASCRQAYPRYLKRQAQLQQKIAAKIAAEQQAGTLAASAARQLRGLVIKAWPATNGSDELTMGAAETCQNFLHSVWDAYLRHSHGHASS